MSGQAELNGSERQPPLNQKPKKGQAAPIQLSNIEEYGEVSPDQNQDEMMNRMADEEAKRLYTEARAEKEEAEKAREEAERQMKKQEEEDRDRKEKDRVRDLEEEKAKKAREEAERQKKKQVDEDRIKELKEEKAAKEKLEKAR